jgi:uncharacterized membrane protein
MFTVPAVKEPMLALSDNTPTVYMHRLQCLHIGQPTHTMCCPCSATYFRCNLPTATMIAGAAAAWLVCKSALAAAAGSTAAAAMLAACLVASYIGGSVNFIAVAAATQLPTGLVPGAMAADNLGMLLLLGLMMAVPLRFLQQRGLVMMPVVAASGAPGGPAASLASTRSSGVSSRSRPAAASSYYSSSSSDSSSGSSSDDDVLALDGSPLLTQPPTELEVSACLQDTSTGTNFTRVLPVDVSGDRKKKRGSSSSSSSAAGSWSSSSGSDTGSSSDDDLLALDGSPLLTQPPTEVEVKAVVQDNSTRNNFTRVLPINVSGSKRPVSSRNSASSSSSTLQQPLPSGPQAAATPGGSAAAAAATGVCGGCRGSGVTAFDDKPLLTRAPAMGDAVSSIAAAREGKQQLLTPPKPPSTAMYTSKHPHTAGGRSGPAATGSSQGYNSERGPDGLIVGCGCCSEALDAIAAASPPPAALLGSSGSSNDDDMIALDGSPLLTSPPSEVEVTACLEATSHGDNQTRVLPVHLSGSKGNNSNGGSSSSSTATTGVVGALALDGSLLLTEEPDSTGLAAAVAAARSGGSNGSSVSVSPLMTGEFELLVKLDKDSLLQRLRHQKKKQKKQQSRARRDAEAVTVTVTAAAPASAAATSSSRAPVAVQGDSAEPVSAHSSSSDALAPAVSASNTSSARGELTASTAAAAVAAAAIAAAAAHQIATALQSPALHQLLLAAIAVGISAAATAVHKLLVGSQSPSPSAAGAGPFAGAAQLGQVLIGVFFAALGASCCCPLSTLACCLPLLAFISIMTATHWALLWGLGGRLMGLQAQVLICGSAAAIGGPATAAGLANARGWGQLVQPSLLCGSLGYALGTGAGLLVAHALGVLP